MEPTRHAVRDIMSQWRAAHLKRQTDTERINVKCPHGLVAFHENFEDVRLGVDKDGGWILRKTVCPACSRLVMVLSNGTPSYNQGGAFVGLAGLIKARLVRPKAGVRPPCPTEVPPDIAGDYTEACLVLADSPKAAAALGRRCLQDLLRGAARVKPGDLANEIQQVLDAGTLPSYLAEAIDAVRNTGNFAAHPMKSQHSGGILDVEPGEAEWNLDVLEQLFDFFYVQPALLAAKRAALNKKLGEAGKPPMK
jgi:hypothetical protein